MNDEYDVDVTPTNPSDTVEAKADTPSDPLDAITDLDTLRAKAKGYRAERNRLKEQPAKESSQFITKEDSLRIATKTAMELVSEDIRGQWDKVVEYIPTKYRTAETPNEIKKAMEIAYNAYLIDNPKKDTSAEDAVADLTKDAGSKGRTQTSTAKKEAPEPVWARKPQGPESWYKKPE